MAEKLIDIEELFRAKNPRLLKFLPGFLLTYLKRVIHQDEVNTFIAEHEALDSFEFAEAAIRKFNITLEVQGLENIPTHGGVILTSNHPLGGMDAIAMICAMKPVRKDIRFIVNDLLLHLKNLNGVFVGVNKHGKTASGSLKAVDELFQSTHAIVVFPAGLVSRKRNGSVKDLEWKKTFVTRAKKHKKDIIPVYIEGRNSNFFYNLANIRAALGIKANIEMLYLVDEMYRQKDKTISIVFGKPVPVDTFTDDRTDAQWAAYIKETVYNLATTKQS